VMSTLESARSISHSTMVERMAMNGKDHFIALLRTLEFLPVAAFHTASNTGLTPFMEAIDFSDYNVVKAMLQLAPGLAMKRFIDLEDSRLYTYPVIFTSQISVRRETSLALNIVKDLTLYVPDDCFTTDCNGQTALRLSVTGYSISTSEWLLENGHGHNIYDNNGRTPIHNIRSTTSLDILLQAGADINSSYKSGLTCAHMAAMQGLQDLLDGLIHRNAELSKTGTCTGGIGSPLHCAVLK
jgi:ankyrin repeat protein